jgi:hypothetical protein
LSGIPHSGLYSTYFGGGYIFQLNPFDSEIGSDLEILNKLGWIDQRTRALFVEFSIFNSNINLFGFCSTLFEFLPIGTILKTSRVSTFKIYDDVTSYGQLETACNIIYMVFVLFLMIQELKSLLKVGYKVYVKKHWIYLNWSLIAFSWATFSMYLYKLFARYDFINKLKARKSTLETINLENLSNFNESLLACVSICSFIGIIKIIKLLRINRAIKFMIDTFVLSFKELIGFLVVLTTLSFAYVNLFFLFFNDKAAPYESVVRSIVSTFQLSLGKGDNTLFLMNTVPLGFVAFITFSIIVRTVLVALFISILCDKYILNQKTVKMMGELKEEIRISIYDYLKSKIRDQLEAFKKSVVINPKVVEDNLTQKDTVLESKIVSINLRLAKYVRDMRVKAWSKEFELYGIFKSQESDNNSNSSN